MSSSNSVNSGSANTITHVLCANCSRVVVESGLLHMVASCRACQARERLSRRLGKDVLWIGCGTSDRSMLSVLELEQRKARKSQMSHSNLQKILPAVRGKIVAQAPDPTPPTFDAKLQFLLNAVAYVRDMIKEDMRRSRAEEVLMTTIEMSKDLFTVAQAAYGRSQGVPHSEVGEVSPRLVAANVRVILAELQKLSNDTKWAQREAVVAQLKIAQVTAGVLQKWCNEAWPPSMGASVVSALMQNQMDSKHSVPATGHGDTGLISSAIKLGRSLFAGAEDSPSNPVIDASTFSLVDIPREVHPLSMKTGDVHPSQHRNFSQKRSTDVFDIIGRCQTRSLVGVGHWATTDAVGVDLYTRGRATQNYFGNLGSVAPGMPFGFNNNTGTALVYHTMMSFYSQFFEYWRGSLIFTVEVVNTHFHKGQLYICVNPNYGTASFQPPATAVQSRNCYAQTMDLSMCNQIDFEVPFNAMMDYCETYPDAAAMRLASPSRVVSQRTTPYSTGCFSVFVQNPLSATGGGVVSGTIDVNFYIRAGPGFEMRVPRPLWDEVNLFNAWRSEVHDADPPDVKLRDEMAGEDLLAGKDDEVGVLTDSPAPPREAPTGHAPAPDREVVAPDVNVARTTYKKMTTRLFLVRTGIIWTTTQTFGTQFFSINVAELLNQPELSLLATLPYNNYLRTRVKFVFKLNTNPTFCGKCWLQWTAPGWTGDAQSVWMRVVNAEHIVSAPVMPSVDTEFSISIPWGHMRRVFRASFASTTGGGIGEFDLEAGERFGRIVLVVQNQLRTGTGGATSLTGSMWAQLEDTYIGFKKARTDITREEMIDDSDDDMLDLSEETVAPSVQVKAANRQTTPDWSNETDTDKSRACGGAPMEKIANQSFGFMTGNHCHMKDLLRRPAYISSETAQGRSYPEERVVHARWPIRCLSVTHGALLATIHAWSGSFRWHFVSNAAATDHLLSWVRLVPLVEEQTVNYSPPQSAPAKNWTGVTFWKPAEQPVFVIQPPHYHALATKSTEKSGGQAVTVAAAFYYSPASMEWGTIFGADHSIHVEFEVYQSISDDFRGYLTCMPPNCRMRNVPTVVEPVHPKQKKPNRIKQFFKKGEAMIGSEGGWVRDLTDEGDVESNPGPWNLMELGDEEDRCVETRSVVSVLRMSPWHFHLMSVHMRDDLGVMSAPIIVAKNKNLIKTTGSVLFFAKEFNVMPEFHTFKDTGIAWMCRDQLSQECFDCHACVVWMFTGSPTLLIDRIVHEMHQRILGPRWEIHICPRAIQFMRYQMAKDYVEWVDTFVGRLIKTQIRMWACRNEECLEHYCECKWAQAFNLYYYDRLELQTAWPLMYLLSQALSDWDDFYVPDNPLHTGKPGEVCAISIARHSAQMKMQTWIECQPYVRSGRDGAKVIREWNSRFNIYQGRYELMPYNARRHVMLSQPYVFSCRERDAVYDESSLHLDSVFKALQRKAERNMRQADVVWNNEAALLLLDEEYESRRFREDPDLSDTGWMFETDVERVRRAWCKRLEVLVQDQMAGEDCGAQEFTTLLNEKIVTSLADEQIQDVGFCARFMNTVKVSIQALKDKCFNVGARKITSPCIEMVTRVYNAVLEHVFPAVIFIIDFTMNIFTVLTTQSRALRAVALTSLATKLATQAHYGTQLLKKLKEVDWSFFLQAQEGSDGTASVWRKVSVGVATALTAGLVALVGGVFSQLDAKQLKESVLWKIGEMSGTWTKLVNGASATTRCWAMMQSGIKTGVQYFVEGPLMYDEWFMDNAVRLRKWQEAFDEDMEKNLFDNNNLFKRNGGETNFERLSKYVVTAKELRAHSGSKLIPTVYLQTALRAITIGAHARKAYENVNRMEPVGVWMYAEAGVGKSILASAFMPAIVLRDCGLVEEADEAARNVWMKPPNPEHQYYDGYASQHYVVVDDFGAGTEDKDALELITLISVAKCPVLMAAIEEKRTMFDSSFVVVTTNQSNTAPMEAVRDKTALQRRFPFAVKLYLRPRFCKSDTDKTADMARILAFIEQETQDDKTSSHLKDVLSNVWTYRLLNLTTGGLSSDERPIGQLLTQMAEEFQKRRGINEKLAAAVSRILVPLRDEMGKWNSASELLGEDPYDEDDDCDSVPVCSKCGDLWHCVCDPVEEIRNRTFVRTPRSQYVEPHRFVTLKERQGSSWKGAIKAVAAILGVVTLVGVIYGAVRLVRSYTSSVVDQLDIEDQGPQYDNSKKQPVKPKASAKASSVKAAMVSQQSEHPEMTQAMKAVRKNIVRVEIRTLRAKARGLWGVLLDNNTLLLPDHFVRTFMKESCPEKQVFVEVRSRSHQRVVGWVPIAVTGTNTERVVCDGFYEGLRDLSVIKLIDQSFAVKNIRCFVMSRVDKDKLQESQQKGMWFDQFEVERAVIHFGQQFSNDLGLKGLAARTQTQSKLGDCGRVYCLATPSVAKPLVGLHVWGRMDEVGRANRETGIADFTLEMIEAAEQLISERVHVGPDIDDWEPCDEPEEVELRDEEDEWFDAETDLIGVVTWNGQVMARHQPTKTCFVKTGLEHAEWDEEYIPPVIGQVHGIHTLKTNAQKFHPRAETTVQPGMFNHVVDFMLERVPETECGPMTLSETINGLEEYTGLTMETSPGFLSTYFAKGKTELFDEVPGEEGESKQYTFSEVARTRVMKHVGKTFVDHFVDEDERACNGQVPRVMWVAVNKDELLKVDKVRRGKVRVFVAPELTFTMLLRKHFGHFIRWAKSQAGFRMCHGIGLDKEAVWAQYLARLREVGEDGFDCDYSNFDGTVSVQAFNVIGLLADKFYGQRDRRTRKALLQAITHSCVIVDRQVIRTHQGNKSGNPATDLFNSLANWFNMLVAFCVAQVKSGQVRDVSLFPKLVRCLTYGDDVITSADTRTLGWYNRKEVAQILDILGYAVTAANKGEEIKEYEPLRELTFLKSSFVESSAIVRAPLPKGVIYRDLMWTRRINLVDLTVLQMKIDAAMDMAFAHGEEFASQLLAQIRETGHDSKKSYMQWLHSVIDKQERAVVPGVDEATMVVTDYLDNEVQWQGFGQILWSMAPE